MDVGLIALGLRCRLGSASSTAEQACGYARVARQSPIGASVKNEDDSGSLRISGARSVREARCSRSRRGRGGDARPRPWAGATQPLRQGKADRIHYAGGWTFDTSDTNSFITEFKYESQ